MSMSEEDRGFIGIGILLIIFALGGTAVHPILGGILVAVFLLFLLQMFVRATIWTIADKIREQARQPKNPPSKTLPANTPQRSWAARGGLVHFFLVVAPLILLLVLAMAILMRVIDDRLLH
jgi:hypothetical protein